MNDDTIEQEFEVFPDPAESQEESDIRDWLWAVKNYRLSLS